MKFIEDPDEPGTFTIKVNKKEALLLTKVLNDAQHDSVKEREMNSVFDRIFGGRKT